MKNTESYIIYDIYNIDEETYEKAKKSVFSEVMIDEVFEDLILEDGKYFAYETLPAQYDQRADSSMQCISLLDEDADVKVRCGNIIVFDRRLDESELKKVEKYLINPIESRVKDMSALSFSVDSEMKPLKDLTGFVNFSKEELLDLKNELSLAMGFEDLFFIQEHFKSIKKRSYGNRNLRFGLLLERSLQTYNV